MFADGAEHQVRRGAREGGARQFQAYRPEAEGAMALPRPEHTRHAHPKPGRDNPGRPLGFQNPAAKVVRVCLPLAPRHSRLRLLPETYESDLVPVPEDLGRVRPG